VQVPAVSLRGTRPVIVGLPIDHVVVVSVCLLPVKEKRQEMQRTVRSNAPLLHDTSFNMQQQTAGWEERNKFLISMGASIHRVRIENSRSSQRYRAQACSQPVFDSIFWCCGPRNLLITLALRPMAQNEREASSPSPATGTTKR